MQDFIEYLGNQLLLFSPRVALAAILAIVFYLASWLLAAMIRNLGSRVNVHKVVADLIAQVVGTTVLIIGVVSVLGTLGVDVTALVAGLGLAGFALGFALKDVLSNVLSGVLLLYYRPFWIEDRIKSSGNEGVVVDIDLRYTTIKTENSQILLPNASLFNNSVEILEKNAKNEVKSAVSAKIAEETPVNGHSAKDSE